MRTTKIEVKTLYSIRFNFHDFCKIFAGAKNDPARGNAFAKFDLEDTTIGNIKDCFDSLRGVTFFMKDGGKQHAEDIQYIVRKLGFDGVENYGGMYEGDTEYSLSVYNRGADI